LATSKGVSLQLEHVILTPAKGAMPRPYHLRYQQPVSNVVKFTPQGSGRLWWSQRCCSHRRRREPLDDFSGRHRPGYCVDLAKSGCLTLRNKQANASVTAANTVAQVWPVHLRLVGLMGGAISRAANPAGFDL
jgi:hypothetical protein